MLLRFHSVLTRDHVTKLTHIRSHAHTHPHTHTHTRTHTDTHGHLHTDRQANSWFQVARLTYNREYVIERCRVCLSKGQGLMTSPSPCHTHSSFQKNTPCPLMSSQGPCKIMQVKGDNRKFPLDLVRTVSCTLYR